MLAGLSTLYRTLVNLCYPPFCVSCRANLEEGWLCATCSRGATKIVPPFCRTCSRPFSGQISGDFCCPDCEENPPGFECAVTCYQAIGVVRELIHRFKYSGEFYLRNPLSDWLQETLRDYRLANEPVDALVPVPLHPARIRERGYDQVQALADRLAKRGGYPVWSCLRRARYTESQTRFSRGDRLRNLRNAFVLRKGSGVLGKHLLLVDDVLTTGSTLDECARVLRQHGAKSVRAVTVARR